MNVLRSIIVLICISFGFSGYSQIDSKDIPDAKISPPSEYSGKSLWGYINGGADLYLEYGFNKLMVQEIEWKGVLLKANIYEMTSDKGAYGIFSVNVHKCKERDVIKEFDCQGPYQYQVFAGKYYISVINEIGKPEAEEISAELGKILLEKIKDVQSVYPDLYTTTLLKDHLEKLKFCKGELGIQNIFADWSDLFTEIKNYKIWLLPLDNINIALIELEDNESTEFFLTQMKTGKAEQFKSWKITDKKLILYESSSDNTDSEKYLQVIEGYIK
ncbi:MAG: hypothetical protein K8S00_00620 [Bacteroidales bacterium]|nr:hypothetical protein [Bacteroidales bacterium]